MKRIVTLLLAAGLMLGASTAAQAVDVKMSGQWDFGLQMGDYTMDSMSKSNGKSKSHNAFYQRLRTQIDVIASEALSGVVLFEIGDNVWGKSSTPAGRGAGGGLGADGVGIKVKRAYLDWIVPQTDLKVRVGIQGFSNPSFFGGYQMFDDDVAGITMNYQFNPTVGVSAWFLRPFAEGADSNYSSNGGLAHRSTNLDMFGFAVPLTFDGVKVTPWMTYAAIGRDAFTGYQGPTNARAYSQMLPRWADTNMDLASDSTGSGWWAGLTGELTLWNPFRFAWDFNYGSVDMGKYTPTGGVDKIDMKREGWILAAIAEYKLDFGTPGLFFWYGSGDDSKVNNGSEMLPSLKGSSKFTTFGFDNAGMDFEGCAVNSTAAGTWGIGLQIAQMSFVQDLKHTIRATYMSGTNSDKMTDNKGGSIGTPYASDNIGGFYLTEKDSAWEFNLDSTYDIYKNLQLGVELGYIRLDLSDSAWGKSVADRAEDGYKIGVGLRYSF